MKHAIVCILVIVFLSGRFYSVISCQDTKLGKTCDEILSMGFDKWLELWSKSLGMSEADVDRASVSYGRCLRAKNDKALEDFDKNVRDRIKAARKLMGEFRNSIMIVHAGYSGGGTLFWHSLNRGIVDDEEMVSKLIEVNFSGNYMLAKSDTNIMKKILADIDRILKRCDSPNKQQLENIRYSGIDIKTVMEELKKAKSAMERLLNWFPSVRPKERFIVLRSAESWASFAVALGRQ